MTTSAREDTNSSATQNAGVGFLATLEAFASEHNIVAGMLTGIVVMGASFLVSLKLPWDQAYLSCVIGLVSMSFAAWVAYWAVRVQDYQYRRAILQPVFDLERRWQNGEYSVLTDMNEDGIQEALDVFESLEKQEVKLDRRIKKNIAIITGRLKKYQKGETRPRASSFKSELKTLVQII